MEYKILKYTEENIDDVIDFELRLRKEDDMGWEINEDYKKAVLKSFRDPNFKNSVSLIYYGRDDRVYGRIDSSLIFSYFDGSTKAYLDWICVIPSYRKRGIAQELMKELRKILKEDYNVNILIGLMDKNEACRRFYKKVEKSIIKDEGIWIEL